MPTPSIYGMPVPFLKATIDKYEAPPGDEAALQIVKEYIDRMRVDGRTQRGLVLTGSPGTGKTMLACAVLNAAHSLGISGAFVSFTGYVKDMQDLLMLNTLARRGDIDVEEWSQAERDLQDLRGGREILVIDDVGKERFTGSEFAETEFDYLIRLRFLRGLTTIVTANILAGQWATKYNPSMLSFLQELGEFVPVSCEDFRSSYAGG